MLNRKQTVILCFGLLLIAAMSLYPPWVRTVSWGNLRTSKRASRNGSIGTVVFSSTRPGEYAFLFQPPEPNHPQLGLGSGIIIDIPRLSLQYVIVVALTALGVVVARELG